MPASYPAAWLDKTVIVYTQHATTGEYSVVANASLSCRLKPASRQAAATAGDRRELADLRRLTWPASYTMPAECQIAVASGLDAGRWNVIIETVAEVQLPGQATAAFRAADCLRARNG